MAARHKPSMGAAAGASQLWRPAELGGVFCERPNDLKWQHLAC
jgi:hypothetical protein